MIPGYMTQPVDYYKVLDIPETSTSSEIKLAYRKQALKYHPDKNNDPTATKEFQEIGEAYEILGNDQERKVYDIDRRALKGEIPKQRTYDNWTEDFWRARDKQEERQKQQQRQQRNDFRPFSTRRTQGCFCAGPYKCAFCGTADIDSRRANKRSRKNRW